MIEHEKEQPDTAEHMTGHPVTAEHMTEHLNTWIQQNI
jgi:hypothetical protein